MGNASSISVPCPGHPCSVGGTQHLVDAAASGDVALFRKVLSKTPWSLLHHKLVDSNLPVHIAAQRGHIAVLCVIIETVAQCTAAGGALRRSSIASSTSTDDFSSACSSSFAATPSDSADDDAAATGAATAAAANRHHSGREPINFLPHHHHQTQHNRSALGHSRRSMPLPSHQIAAAGEEPPPSWAKARSVGSRLGGGSGGGSEGGDNGASTSSATAASAPAAAEAAAAAVASPFAASSFSHAATSSSAVGHGDAEALRRDVPRGPQMLCGRASFVVRPTKLPVLQEGGGGSRAGSPKGSGGGGGLVPPWSGALTMRLAHVQLQVATVVDMPNHKGQTPLMFAAFHGHADIIELLLQQGAEPWCASRSGRTALHYAALGCQEACVHALLDTLPAEVATKGAARLVDKRSLGGFTPLLCAVAMRHLPTVRALLKHRPDILLSSTDVGSVHEPVNMAGCVRVSPLHLAARNGDEAIAMEILRFHMESGAEPRHDPRRRVSSWGWPPFQTAASYGHARLAEMLRPQRPLDDAFLNDDEVHFVGVPTLQYLASSALRQHLVDGCQAAVAAAAAAQCAFLLGSSASLLSTAWSDLEERMSPRAGASRTSLVDAGSPLGGTAPSVGSATSPTSPRPVPTTSTGQLESPRARSASPPGGRQLLALVSRHNRRLSEAGATCGVCLDEREAVQSAPCRHRLCAACAQELAHRMFRKPMACPFCRAPISGFGPITSA